MTVFSSNFGPGVTLDPLNGELQGISGTDQNTGSTWPFSLWGSTFSGLQVLSFGGSIQNQIQTVTGPNGTPTTALFQSIIQKGSGSTQDPLMVYPGADPVNADISYDFQFQPNLAQQLAAGPENWRTLFEFKTGTLGGADNPDFVFGIGVQEDSSGHLYWIANTDPGSFPYDWTQENHTVPVPAGQWFHFEVSWHRSTGGDGYIWATINGQTIVDRVGPNIGASDLPINRIMVDENYSGGGTPTTQLITDLQISDTSPGPTPGSGTSTPISTPTTTPSPTPSATLSTDGSILMAGTSGSLVTSDGTWTLGATTTSGDHIVLLNGQQAANGAASELIVDNHGHLYAENAQGNWYEWATSGWLTSTDPTAGQSGSSTPSATPTTTTSGLSADGSIMLVGTNGSLVTTDGTWTFGTSTTSGDHVILLNGQPATNGAGLELIVDNNGHLYAENTQGNWYEWINSGWAASADPTTSQTGTSTPSPTPPTTSGLSSAGSTLITGMNSSLVTSDGTWTFAQATAQGGDVILLNGHPASNGAATSLVVDTQGHLFADNAQGNWYEWNSSSWSFQGSTPPSTNPLAPTFVDSGGHDIFVFSALPKSAAEIAHFDSSIDIVDLAPLLKAVGYHGTDPLADHVVTLTQVGTHSTAVMVDPTGVDPNHGTTVLTLAQVVPQDVHAANIWH